MAKMSAALCFALLTGASAAATQPAKHISLLDHKHEVNISYSAYWRAATYSSECWMKRPLSLSTKAAALVQNKVFLQGPDNDNEITGGPAGGYDDYHYGDGNGEIDNYGDGNGELENYGDGNGELEGSPPEGIGGSPPAKVPAAPPPTPTQAPSSPPPTTVTVLKDGFMTTQCVKDYMYYFGDKYGKGRHSYRLGQTSKASIVRYNMAVAKEDQEQMTPKVCFEFCRTVPGMSFFGILNGRSCYCTPYYQEMAGDSSQCDAVCPGDPTNMCGGKSKSQIYGMHMCDDAQADLTASAEKATLAEADLKKKAEDAKTLATNMQNGAASLQKSLGAAGDTAATDLMQKAKVAAGEIEHQAEDVEKVVVLLGELTVLADKTKTNTDAVRDAENVTATIGKALAQGKEAADKLEKSMHLATSSADDFGKDVGTAQQYYPIMYFVNKDFIASPSTCSGDSVGEPMADVSLDACAWACDENVGSCVGFSYFGQERLCFLMSKFKTAFYYTGCGTTAADRAQSFLQQRKVADVTCMAKFSQFEGTTLKPDGSGKCKQCLKAVTKADRCYK